MRILRLIISILFPPIGLFLNYMLGAEDRLEKAAMIISTVLSIGIVLFIIIVIAMVNASNKQEEDLYKDIEWKIVGSGKKVMSIKNVSLKASISEDRLKAFVKNIREKHEDINVLYDSYLEKENKDKKKVAELEEMFKDNYRVVVFNQYNK